MNRVLLILPLTILLASCGERATPNSNFDPSIADKNCKDDSLAQLPDGISIPFAHKLYSDSFYINKINMIRRRVVLQYHGIDATAANEAIDKAFREAGFSIVDSKTLPSGHIHTRLHKKQFGVTHLFVRPHAYKNTAGSILFDLPPPSFNSNKKQKKAIDSHADIAGN